MIIMKLDTKVCCHSISEFSFGRTGETGVEVERETNKGNRLILLLFDVGSGEYRSGEDGSVSSLDLFLPNNLRGLQIRKRDGTDEHVMQKE